MPEEKQYIVIYHLERYWPSLYYPSYDRRVFGPASLDDCEKRINEERNFEYNTKVYDVTYYRVKPVKGRYDWEE